MHSGKSTAIIQALIEHKANINHLNIYKRTAFTRCCYWCKNNRIVTYLIEITSSNEIVIFMGIIFILMRSCEWKS